MKGLEDMMPFDTLQFISMINEKLIRENSTDDEFIDGGTCAIQHQSASKYSPPETTYEILHNKEVSPSAEIGELAKPLGYVLLGHTRDLTPPPGDNLIAISDNSIRREALRPIHNLSTMDKIWHRVMKTYD